MRLSHLLVVVGLACVLSGCAFRGGPTGSEVTPEQPLGVGEVSIRHDLSPNTVCVAVEHTTGFDIPLRPGKTTRINLPWPTVLGGRNSEAIVSISCSRPGWRWNYRWRIWQSDPDRHLNLSSVCL